MDISFKQRRSAEDQVMVGWKPSEPNHRVITPQSGRQAMAAVDFSLLEA
jgi:hypothetical protein